ncbi:hypothetical protein D3OALGA1CA_1631 [Olavius algarvensis associated proteobacterium Delta 3]|nr:hypothetical protein D3OALGB2SA_1601 [Olavius algarvensis associated proteobacterium Delta 3]CAB5104353.1 hypothetical protein D3OALGA1CA_1631 [Olavius algarvensis associated proteobacterium Delta 3]
MPTPTQDFADIAAKYGNIDPQDPEAVQHWFSETLPSMAPAQIEAILEDLLSRDGGEHTRQEIRTYPSGIPLPTLSAAPHAPIPLLAGDWKMIWKRLRQILLKSKGGVD